MAEKDKEDRSSRDEADPAAEASSEVSSSERWDSTPDIVYVYNVVFSSYFIAVL